MNKTITPQQNISDPIHVGPADEFPPAILDDYFHKRQSWYYQRRGIADLAAERDAFDEEGLIVLASDGTECLGGVRLNTRAPGDMRPFPSEVLLPGLSVRAAFPGLALDGVTVGEMGKLLIAGQTRGLPYNNRILLRMALCLLEMNRQGPQAHFAFLSTRTRALRIYRQIAKITRLPFETCAVPQHLVPNKLHTLGDVSLQLYELPIEQSGETTREIA